MHVFVCIDDTDNLESRGTGELASLLADDVDKNGWGKSSFITRHQLLVHPDVPYTSHNSSMCFSADIEAEYLDTLISHASDFLEKESAEGSDPGLCVAVTERLKNSEALIEFGKKAKQVVVTQSEAYELAQRLELHLTAHGGTGHGVIGALAGVGLRLSGNDGRLKGWFNIGTANSIAAVRDLCAHPDIDMVRSLDGKTLLEDELVRLDERVKSVFLEGKSVVLVTPAAGESGAAPWRLCSKQQLKNY
jgi:hypothetical protein